MFGLNSQTLMDLLSLVLLPLVLTGLVPWITRSWQNRRNELEIKTELVTEISEAVMKTVMIIDLATTHEKESQNDIVPDDRQRELYEAYKDWEVRRCIIGSKLHAYFPAEKKGEEQIHEKWDRFAKRVANYYTLKSNIGKKKCESDLEKERKEMLQQKANIIQEILFSKITGFRFLSGQKQAPTTSK